VRVRMMPPSLLLSVAGDRTALLLASTMALEV
jgi:hypothetical protein